MSELKEEIRTVLREELMLIKDELRGRGQMVKQVAIHSNDELMIFVRDLLDSAKEAAFVEQINEGTLRFELIDKSNTNTEIQNNEKLEQRRQVSISKTLITERDIGNLTASEKTINIWKSSRLTPLAKDEIRRRGITIERIET
ncbi:MAG: hypothetical protein P8H46_02085 [Paracoccaceae bacterium]|nr:hypothetical protein [Paracoccaceae bacterium]